MIFKYSLRLQRKKYCCYRLIDERIDKIYLKKKLSEIKYQISKVITLTF